MMKALRCEVCSRGIGECEVCSKGTRDGGEVRYNTIRNLKYAVGVQEGSVRYTKGHDD